MATIPVGSTKGISAASGTTIARTADVLGKVKDMLSSQATKAAGPGAKLSWTTPLDGVLAAARDALKSSGGAQKSIGKDDLVNKAMELVTGKLSGVNAHGADAVSKDEVLKLHAADSEVGGLVAQAYGQLTGRKIDLPTGNGATKIDATHGAHKGDHVGGKTAAGNVAAALGTAAQTGTHQGAIAKRQSGGAGLGFDVGAETSLPAAVQKSLTAMGPSISGKEMGTFLDAAVKNGTSLDDVADQLIKGSGPLGDQFSMQKTDGKHALSLDAVNELTKRMSATPLPEKPSKAEVHARDKRLDGLAKLATDPRLSSIDLEQMKQTVEQESKGVDGPKLLAQAKQITGRGNVLSKKELAAMPDGPLKNAALHLLDTSPGKAITAELLVGTAAELMANAPDGAAQLKDLIAALPAEARQHVTNLANAPLWSVDGQALLAKLTPDAREALTQAAQSERNDLLSSVAQGQIPLMLKGKPVQGSALEQVIARLPPEAQKQVLALNEQPLFDQDQQQLMGRMPPEQQAMLQLEGMQARQTQMMNAAVGQLNQVEPGKIAYAPPRISWGDMASSLVQTALGASAGAFGAFSGWGMNPFANPAQMGNIGLVNMISNAPLFSPDEQEMMKKLPPEQQAMMTLQAKKQRESLMTSVLTNISNMKHEQLKQISQNLRG